MAFGRDAVRRIYEKRAPLYDLTANLYYLIGFREQAYRRRAVQELALEPGDTVVELCCGTGLNLPLLRAAVGPAGRVVGVDLTEAMLRRARERVERRGWDNVELVCADVGSWPLPHGVGGFLSTFALTLVPEYEEVIRRAADALDEDGRLVILDLKRPEWAPDWLMRLAVAITRPFAVTGDLMARHPWEAVHRELGDVTLEDLYFGFTYIARGTRTADEE